MMALIASGCGDHQGAAGPRGQGKTAGGGAKGRAIFVLKQCPPSLLKKKKRRRPSMRQQVPHDLRCKCGLFYNVMALITSGC